MTEQAVVQAGEIGATPQEIKKKKAAKRRRKKVIKNIITLLILAGVAYGGYLGFQKLFADKETEKQALTDFTYIGSISTSVTGGGVTKPLSSESVTAGFKCKVDSVLAPVGSNVMIGDPLYTINTEEVAKELEAAQKQLEAKKKEYETALRQPEAMRQQIAAIQKKQEQLSVYAPFTGKVMNAAVQKGDMLGENGLVCQFINDSTMLLTQYFSYAYANDIKAGDAALISIPSTMSNVAGKIREINMVERISAEGTKLFEVVFEMSNPGTLTEGVAATGTVVLVDGSKVTPYEAGKLSYSEVRNVYSAAGGEVVSKSLRDYTVVEKGGLLLELLNGNYDEQITDIMADIAQIEEGLITYQENIDKAQTVITDLEEKMQNNMVFSPVNGMVSSVMIIGGQTVEPGYQMMTISDSSVMTIDARIDSLNIGDVVVGAEVQLTQYGMDYDTQHTGVIADISLEGRYENNYSYFPAIIRVDNAEGQLLSGTYVQYNIVANQSNDCVVAPAQCVKSTDEGMVVFVKSEEKPENAVELGEGVEVPEGFWPVPVKTGLSDNYSVEILEGIGEGAELFLQYMTDSGSSWQNGGIMF